MPRKSIPMSSFVFIRFTGDKIIGFSILPSSQFAIPSHVNQNVKPNSRPRSATDAVPFPRSWNQQSQFECPQQFQ
jgi:hypothetical protein